MIKKQVNLKATQFIYATKKVKQNKIKKNQSVNIELI